MDQREDDASRINIIIASIHISSVPQKGSAEFGRELTPHTYMYAAYLRLTMFHLFTV
jgi:hypothetical protein